MAPLSDEELGEAKAYGVKAVITAAVVIPCLLILLHFAAACAKVDFSVVKEAEILVACLAVVGLVAKFAFGKEGDK